jgi:hypothetical protein
MRTHGERPVHKGRAQIASARRLSLAEPHHDGRRITPAAVFYLLGLTSCRRDCPNG